MTAPTLTAKFPVGERFVCELAATLGDRLDETVITVHWSPHPPRALSVAEREDYRDGRDFFMRALSDHLGKTIAVVDV